LEIFWSKRSLQMIVGFSPKVAIERFSALHIDSEKPRFL
tara:strand:+ start:224 stop:340 length:117 start_codon:yes stop_codon:yes gene_type:complete